MWISATALDSMFAMVDVLIFEVVSFDQFLLKRNKRKTGKRAERGRGPAFNLKRSLKVSFGNGGQIWSDKITLPYTDKPRALVRQAGHTKQADRRDRQA